MTTATRPWTASGPDFIARARAAGTSPWLPSLGYLLALALIVSRRPDAVFDAQFWAEDGRRFFANVYNHGLLATLVVPQAGYLQTFSVLTAGAASLLPLAAAPLAMNVAAILVQALPVGLLLSDRAASIAPDLRIRVLLAALYLGLPAAEVNANVTNAQWHLAVAALLVLMRRPASDLRARACDGAILLLAGLTGPFALLLAPLAALQRRWRGPLAVPRWAVALLACCAAVQVGSLTVVSHHPPRGFGVEPRASIVPVATPATLGQIIGGRALAAPVVGDPAAAALGRNTPAVMLVAALGLLGILAVGRAGPPELRLALAFGGGVLALALLRPPADLFTFTYTHDRYFVLPHLAVLAALVWAAASLRARPIRLAAVVALVATIGFVMPRAWFYPAYRSTDFSQRSAAFDRAPRGTTMRFAVNPLDSNWTMVLRKR